MAQLKPSTTWEKVPSTCPCTSTVIVEKIINDIKNDLKFFKSKTIQIIIFGIIFIYML